MLKTLLLSVIMLLFLGAGKAQSAAQHIENHVHINASSEAIAGANIAYASINDAKSVFHTSLSDNKTRSRTHNTNQFSKNGHRTSVKSKLIAQKTKQTTHIPVYIGQANPVPSQTNTAAISIQNIAKSSMNGVLASEPSADSFPHETFTQAPFIRKLAQQISEGVLEYTLGDVRLKKVRSSANASSDVYYAGDDGLTSMLVKYPAGDFIALLVYQGKSYRFNALTVKLVTNEFGHDNSQGKSVHNKDTEESTNNQPETQHAGFNNSFWESYQLPNLRTTQSRESNTLADKSIVNSGTKKVRVMVSENAIIEEYQNSGEVNFSSLYERIQTGIDFANLALVTSGVEALQTELSDIAVQRLPYDYKDEVIEQDVFKRIAFPIWGEQDATFQMTALALTQNKADIIYNLGAREHFQNNACGFATIGVNGNKTDTLAYSTDHTYPIAINIKLGCETGRTPVHELGHTIGLHHERDNIGNSIVEGASTPYAHNFGYTSSETPAYSIMSYGLGCTQANGSASCERASVFSSPKLRYGDTTFGVSKAEPEAADAVRFLNDTWALRFSNEVKPMRVTPLPSGGFTLNWDDMSATADSQIMVISKSGHLRYNYVLDNHAIYNHEKIEIALPVDQTSYTFTHEQMLSLGLQSANYDTVSIFTGHVNEYDDMIPHLQAQLHAGRSFFMNGNTAPTNVIHVDGNNLETPQAGDPLTFSFDVSDIPNFILDDVKLMTVLDAQYNAGFTTAVARREFNPTNPMLDFFDYELVQYSQNRVELRIDISADYRDYAGFLQNRETSNYKLPIVGFYLAYDGRLSGSSIETNSQEVAIDLTDALDIVPFIQAESLAKVIDNDREEPLSLIFSSTQEIALSDIYASIRGASFYQIGDVVSSIRQLPNKDGKFQYEVIAQNPHAIDDEGAYYASVSFGIESLNLFSTTMIVASNNLMFEENNASRVKVSSVIEMPLSFSVTNLPQEEFDEEVSISTPNVGDAAISVKGNLQRVNEQRGIVSFMFDPEALNRPTRLRVNAQALVGKSSDEKKAQHWVDVEYNVAPQIVAGKTTFAAMPGSTVTIPVPQIDDADDTADNVSYSWEKEGNAPAFRGQEANILVNIASEATPNSVYTYTFEATDGIDTDTLIYSITVEEPLAASTQQTPSPTAPANQVIASATPTNQGQNDAQSGGSLGFIIFSFLLPFAVYRRFDRAH